MPFELFFNNVGNLTLRLKQTRVRRYFTRFGRVCPNQINSDFAAPKAARPNRRYATLKEI